ncbi:MAG: DUF4082 domain-containing protein [Sulfuritalea sp.]|nr:DUF4082 domain-containing protein [Sulfuritalea sp.]
MSMTLKLKRISVTALAAIGFAIAGQAHAAPQVCGTPGCPAINMLTPGAEYGSLFTLGFKFSVPNNALATSLGVYDSGRDGLSGAAQVAIWDTAGQQLISATIPSGTGGELDGFFRYVSIPSFSLLAGTQYIIGAHTTSQASSLFTGEGGSGSVDPNLTLIRDAFSTSGFSFPNQTNGYIGAWLGANFRMTAPIPEPETYQMLALGLLAITAVALRRRKPA